MSTPPEELLGFLARQPETISGNIYFVVAMPHHDWNRGPPPNMREVVERLFRERDGHLLLDATLHAMVALDYQFDRPRLLTQALRSMPAEMRAEDPIRTMELQGPMREVHFDRARADWTALRRGALSFGELRQWETSLMSATFGLEA